MILVRKIFQKLKEQAKDRKISLVLGARQVGKSTVLKALHDDLSKEQKCLFLDLDILSNYEKVSSFENIVNLLKLNGYEEQQKDFFYIFLDEFQKYTSLVKIMKNVYDTLHNVKIFASGSSSLTIKNQVQESLAGRKIINELFPLDFEEFLLFKKEDALVKNLKNIKKLKGDALASQLIAYKKLLEEFMVFGSYPEVALKNSKEEKIQILASIFDLYVKKDLVEYLNIEKILHVKRLIEFLAVNYGQKIKYEEISKVTSLSFLDAKKYIEILKETYIIEIVRPFFKNKNKELAKIPKIYFIDSGVRNYFINNFNALKLRNDAGFLFEGFVLSEFIKFGRRDIKFWQEKNKEEVDFILVHEGKITPVEIKYKEELKSHDFLGLTLFFEMYPQVKEGFLVNLSVQKKERKIHVILPYIVAEETCDL